MEGLSITQSVATTLQIFDISVPLRSGMPAWPSSIGCTVERMIGLVPTKSEVINSALHLDLHCGTHVDAPLHCIPSGSSVEGIDLHSCIGPAFVADMRGIRGIGARHLQDRVPTGTQRLLLKTDNGPLWGSSSFVEGFSALSLEGAQWVADQKMRLIANDYLSIQLFGGDPRTHLVLMNAGTTILEGVDLSAVDSGPYHLVCLPLRIVGAEAAPARVVLIAAGGRDV